MAEQTSPPETGASAATATAEPEAAKVQRALEQCTKTFSDEKNAGALSLLQFLNEQVLREQDIFWQRFYAFATLHAGAFVLYSSDAIKPKGRIAAAGVALGLIWLYTQWASLHYANRFKKLYHPLRLSLKIDWNVGKRGLFAKWLSEARWASSTNAGLLTAAFVAAVWVWVLLFA